MRDQFFMHIAAVLRQAKDRGMTIDFVKPEDCTEAQTIGILWIMRGRGSDAVTVFRANGTMFLAYDDPRYPLRISYLAWTDDGRWDKPSGEALKVVQRLEPTSPGAPGSN